MSDHPLFPESQEDNQIPVQQDYFEQTVPLSAFVQQPESNAEPQSPASEPIAEPQPMFESYAEPQIPMQEPQPIPRATVTTPPPIRPNFDPYTGRPTSAYVPPYRPYNSAPQPPAPKKSEPKKEPKMKGVGWRLAIFGLCFALLGSGIGGFIVGLLLKPQDTEQPVQDTMKQESLLESQEPTQGTVARPSGSAQAVTNLSSLYEAAVPSIVGISNEYTTYNYFGQASTASSTGTGFIISADGEILTNYHVIENAEILTVTMYDGTEYSAEVLGFEAESDVALLKVEATGLTPVVLGDSDALLVGEQITAIGNPLGELTYTMTVGYVSAKSRAVYTDEMPINMMQIDAAINPGNSGGPLFNMSGEVVGITTAKYSGTVEGSATIEGIGFAIPINDVLAIVDDLREFGSVQNRAYIGVIVNNSVAAGEIPAGALVQSIERGSAGDNAGLRISDIITAVGDAKVYGVDTLYQALRPYRGGDSVELTVFRSGETMTLTITFDSTPSATVEETPSEYEEPTESSTYGFPWDYIFP